VPRESIFNANYAVRIAARHNRYGRRHFSAVLTRHKLDPPSY
jgi:hypothetical protein